MSCRVLRIPPAACADPCVLRVLLQSLGALVYGSTTLGALLPNVGFDALALAKQVSLAQALAGQQQQEVLAAQQACLEALHDLAELTQTASILQDS